MTREAFELLVQRLILTYFGKEKPRGLVVQAYEDGVRQGIVAALARLGLKVED